MPRPTFAGEAHPQILTTFRRRAKNGDGGLPGLTLIPHPKFAGEDRPRILTIFRSKATSVPGWVLEALGGLKRMPQEADFMWLWHDFEVIST